MGCNRKVMLSVSELFRGRTGREVQEQRGHFRFSLSALGIRRRQPHLLFDCVSTARWLYNVLFSPVDGCHYGSVAALNAKNVSFVGLLRTALAKLLE